MQKGIIEDFQQEAVRIVQEGEKQGTVLRLMGACAIKIHCNKHKNLYEEMNRPLTDLDFITYRNRSQYLTELFTGLGYQPNDIFIQMHGDIRHIYLDTVHKRIVDVFFDKLSFCHTIDFRNRLELDSPTLPLADLFLGKMQIATINEKDLKDVTVLLAEHEIGDSDTDTINGKYIAKLLAADWGFSYTVTTNLKRLGSYVENDKRVSHEVQEAVKNRIDALLSRLECEPKTTGWKLRAKIGTKKKWYNEVEEVVR